MSVSSSLILARGNLPEIISKLFSLILARGNLPEIISKLFRRIIAAHVAKITLK